VGSHQRVKIPAFYSIKICRNSQGSQWRSPKLHPCHSHVRLRTGNSTICKCTSLSESSHWSDSRGKRFVRLGPPKTDKTENKQKLGVWRQIYNISETLLHPGHVFCNSTESPDGKDQKFRFCCNCHYLRTGLSTARIIHSVLRIMDLSTQKLSTSLKCKLIFFVDSMLAPRKNSFDTGCPRRNVKYFRRVFLMLNYTDITENTYIPSWMVKEIMAREIWNFDSCYTLIDYQIHIENGRNMWFP